MGNIKDSIAAEKGIPLTWFTLFLLSTLLMSKGIKAEPFQATGPLMALLHANTAEFCAYDPIAIPRLRASAEFLR